MKKQNGMINLSRPLVIYDSMCLEFKHLNFTHPKVEMLEPELSINGKRGEAHLHFQIKSDDEVVGSGYKKSPLPVSGNMKKAQCRILWIIIWLEKTSI